MCVFAAAVFVLLLNVFWVPTAAHAAGGLTLTTSQTNVSCNGGGNGTATVVTASGGTWPYTYSWAPGGGTNASAAGLIAGAYTVTVTDSTAGTPLTGTQSITITQPTRINASAATTGASANGGTQGTASVTPTGGAGGYTYLWSTGATTSQVTGLSAGKYSVTITDANSCIFTFNNIEVVEYPAAPSITGNPSNRTIAAGGNTTFIVTADNATGFQWQVNEGAGYNNLSNGSVYSGATTAVLSITGATAGMDGYVYRAIVSGTTAPVAASSGATLTVNAAPAPTVTYVSPTAGPTSGGTSVIITGTNFSGTTAVTFGATAATGYTVNSATQITATAPAGTGTVDVRVTTASGTSATSAADQFTYVGAPAITSVSPATGPSTGGTTVTITGTGFGGATAVTFGASSATGFTVNSATQITATAPAGTGTVDIRVTTAGGTSATSAADQFTYVVAPAIPSLSISDVTQNEGNSGGAAFNFTVTLTSASASAVTVNYATSNGSATAPSDYTATSGALTFAPGQITQTVTVQVNGDTTVEPDETFFVNLSSPFNATLGKSQGVATIVNDDNALSVSAPNKTVSVAAGAEAVVDVVAGATGGPFTAATVVSLAPASAGVATIAGGTGAYSVRFVPAASFAGVAVVTYTLTNGAVQSAPATVTITVGARVDAAQDAEVAGLATAQASAAQRFTTAQVTNFTQRLESLHASGWGQSSFGLTLATDDTRKMARNGNGVADKVINGNPLSSGMRTVGLKAKRVAQAEPAASDLPDLPGAAAEQARSPWAFWVNGAISYGRERTGDADERYRFTTNGISAGVDYRVNGWITVGTGLGISTDRSRVGNKGTRSNADSTVAVAYASMRPMQGVFVDALLGYGVLSFDSKRYITATGDMATGSRDGKQLFGSIATGLEFYRADWMWSPYARLEFSQAKLDAYTENGPATHALKYFDQTARSSKAVLGARAEGKMAVRWGYIMPQVRVEYARSFDEQNEAGLAYADLADQGPAYTLRGRAMDIGRWTVGLGGRLLLRSGTELGVEYTTNIDQSNAYVGSLRLGLRVPF